MYAALNRRLLRRTSDPCERRNKSGTAHPGPRSPILPDPPSSAPTRLLVVSTARLLLLSAHARHEKQSRWDDPRGVGRSRRGAGGSGEERLRWNGNGGCALALRA